MRSSGFFGQSGPESEPYHDLDGSQRNSNFQNERKIQGLCPVDRPHVIAPCEGTLT